MNRPRKSRKADHQRLERLFESAVAISPEEREAWLAAECGEDAELRRQVEELLDADEGDGFVRGVVIRPSGPPGPDDTMPDESPHEPREEEPGPDVIGPYRILEKLGEGGMGMVYLAEQAEPMRRRVAIKVIKLGMDTKEVLARFEAERQALALMNHSHIARVYDAGATREGRPYFVMEHCPGLPITEYCDQYRLDTRQRLKLFLGACRAVQHAHQRGIIHRDLKPSNILVVIHEDGRPLPKIIDFGVAKAMNARLTDRTHFTEQGRIIGTPEYMSPEQAELTRLDVDTRSDIYSLGVLLYELLVGQLPFDSNTLREVGFAEVLRVIKEEEAPKPSTRLSSLGATSDTVARTRRVKLPTLIRQLRGDLDWITMQCLDKDRTRRYESAADLAADLGRFLDHEPVMAGPPSRVYWVSKFVRRHRWPVVASAVALMTLVTGFIVSTALYFETRDAKEVAETERSAAMNARLLEADARALAEARYREVLRHADAKRLNDYAAAAEELWPPYPERLPELERWLARARDLHSRLPLHEASLADVRSRGTVVTMEEGDGGTRQWTFEDPDLEADHEMLRRLVEELRRFGARTPAPGAISQVSERLDFARTIEERSVTGPEAARAWSVAIADIERSKTYEGMPPLRPQLGMLPLRRDPDSNLWEFWHILSGSRPRRAETGATNPWVLSAETGIVLILIPGGTFTLGAQSEDPEAPMYDPFAEPKEEMNGPDEVTLSPYFISRYELTQPQWERVTGENPSYYGPTTKHYAGPASPVTNVSWNACQRFTRRLGLVLPTEAQWEMAARGGTTSPWFTGDTAVTLQGYANLADRHCKENGGSTSWAYDLELDDGYVAASPTGHFKPNPYGLHDTAGNVSEWCLDLGAAHASAVREGTGERIPDPRSPRLRMWRGGSWDFIAVVARPAKRNSLTPDYELSSLGLRPACLVK